MLNSLLEILVLLKWKCESVPKGELYTFNSECMLSDSSGGCYGESPAVYVFKPSFTSFAGFIQFSKKHLK